jgi:hypothetical protein
MAIQELVKILTLLKSLKITEVAVEKKEGNKVLFRGKDRNGSIIVCHEVEMEEPPSYLMGIHKLDVFLDRLSLFNLSAAKLELHHNRNIAKYVSISQGRKSITYTFTSPDNISPKYVSEDKIAATLKIVESTDLFDAISAIKPEAFTVEGKANGDIRIKLFDGISDSYEDESFSKHNLIHRDWSYSWRTESIVLLIKESFKHAKQAVLQIGERGLLFININGMRFIVAPVMEKL